MPCYEVRTVQVEFKAQSREILLKALDDNKINYRMNENAIYSYRWTINFEEQTATVEQGYEGELNKIRRAYSEAVISEVARRKKWLVKKTAEGKMQLKRY